MPVIDASILASYLVRDELFEEAKEILSTWGLLAPDLLIPEVTNVIWKHVYLYRRIREKEAIKLIEGMKILVNNIKIINSMKVIDNAFKIAVKLGITMYDSIYLALAINNNDKLETFDKKLKNKVQGTEYEKYVKI